MNYFGSCGGRFPGNHLQESKGSKDDSDDVGEALGGLLSGIFGGDDKGKKPKGAATEPWQRFRESLMNQGGFWRPDRQMHRGF